MLITSSIIAGFIRLVLIILVLYYLKTKFVASYKNDNFLDFIVVIWFRYAALIVLLIFVLVLVKAYNLFNIFLFLALTISMDLIGLKNLKNPKLFFEIRIKKELLSFLKRVENKNAIWSWFQIETSVKSKNKILLFFTTICLVFITFISRYYFIIYDNYLLSEDWINDINGVVKFDLQEWFDPYSLSIDGEFALVNYYSKITYVSPEVALQVQGIATACLLSILIFWSIHKLTTSKFVAPLLAALSFSLVYVITPINIYYLLKLDQTAVALSFAIPIFIFYLKPGLLRITKFSYFMSWNLGFLAIGLIDLFTLLILIPPFLVIGFIFSNLKNKVFNLIGILAYIIAIAILFVIYSIECHYKSVSLLEFLQANLINVSSYSYVPQMAFPFSIIIQFFQYCSMATIVFILPLAYFKKENWYATIVFILFFNFMILLTIVNCQWIDNELVINSLAIFMPLIFGFMIATVCRILSFITPFLKNQQAILALIVILLSIFLSIRYQEHKIKTLQLADQTPQQILDAYDQISKTYFPFSYAVVNDASAQIISTNKHFFINYDFFINEYATIDSVYFKHVKNKQFVIDNSKYALSKSILVFVIRKTTTNQTTLYAKNEALYPQLMAQLNVLKKRGRKINIFYKSNLLDVYEIINEPKSSTIHDLIF